MYLLMLVNAVVGVIVGVAVKYFLANKANRLRGHFTLVFCYQYIYRLLLAHWFGTKLITPFNNGEKKRQGSGRFLKTSGVRSLFKSSKLHFKHDQTNTN